jgi:response regulator RpfG family c-di-GMP phosphodiesterase
MKLPIRFLLEPDAETLAPLIHTFAEHFQDQYRLITTSSGETALDLLQDLAETQEMVALILTDQQISGNQQISGMSGTAFLATARRKFPDARRVLLANIVDTETAILSINEVGIDRYFVKPWNPETTLPILADDHVAKAAVILINQQIRRLPVVKSSYLVGTVSRANICQAVVGD